MNPLMVTSKAETMVLPVWELALPLPGVLMIAVGLYMIVLGMVLWLYHCLRDRCSCVCGDCCPEINPCEQCLTWGEMCDCQLPNLCSCLDQTHPTPSCPRWDCACTCQPPECESFNCLCFEIKIR